MGKIIYKIIGVMLVVCLITIISTIVWYKGAIKAVNSKGNADQIEVEIKSGMSTSSIISLLKEKNVIKNKLATKIFIKLHGIKNLQAGKYEIYTDMDLENVLKQIVSGNVKDESIKITFQEGKNMRSIAALIGEKTNNSKNDVYNLLEDDKYITSLIDKYWFLTKDIQNKNIYYALEGYLYPDTYQFESKDVSVKAIFEKMLDQTNLILSKNKKRIEKSNFSVHEILTMASIVELEGNSGKNRPKIASVIYNRLAEKMSLGSDVTTYYAIKVDMGERDLYAREIENYNAYNTRGPNMAGKLPVGPIANVSEESIESVLHPDESEYLYFVADKNGEIYFSKTYQEHEETIATLKKRGLWYEYK